MSSAVNKKPSYELKRFAGDPWDVWAVWVVSVVIQQMLELSLHIARDCRTMRHYEGLIRVIPGRVQ